MSEPTPVSIHLDSRNLAGIAHPTRVRILAILRTEGPTTATALAHQLGLNSGATSYHLRQLAEHGFIEDDPERGNKRERWWRATSENTVRPPDELITEENGLGAAYMQSVARVQADNLLKAADARPLLPPEWRAVQDSSDYLLRLTPEAAAELRAEIHGVLARYMSDLATLRHPAEGTARVVAQFQLFPRHEDLDLAGEPDGPGTEDDR